MEKLITLGRIMFASGLLGLGFLCFIYKDFIIGRPPALTQGVAMNTGLLYFVVAIFIFAALGIFFLPKWGWQSCLIIASMILCFSVSRHILHFKFGMPNGYKALALMGGALIVGSTYTSKNHIITRFNSIAGLTGDIFLTIFFIVGGYSHFKFADFVKEFIPSYIPFRQFWGYFCGVCLIAGGIGIHVPRLKKMTALLSAIMLIAWFILLHIPRFISNPDNASDRMGLCESLAFAGILFCLTSRISKKDNAVKQFRPLRPI